MNDIFQNFSPDDLYGAIAEQAKGRVIPQAAREWFTANNVPPINLVKTHVGYYDIVLHDDVIFLDNGCFEFSRYQDGMTQHALTFVCWSHDGSAIDVCAWQAMTGRVATWLGQAAMLGEDYFAGPRLDDGLPVHAGPLEWFKANRTGVVVLDGKRAAPLLRDVGTLTVSSIDQGRRLKKILAVELPNILVPAEVAA